MHVQTHVVTFVYIVIISYLIVYTSHFPYISHVNNKRHIRDPFADKPPCEKSVIIRQNKRTQRYRSTAKSRIFGMTVGDIRYCFQQLRGAGDSLCPDFMLYNGLCAGEFTLLYLIETTNSMKKRRKRKRNRGYVSEENEESVEDPTDEDLYIVNQLPKPHNMEMNIHHMEF